MTTNQIAAFTYPLKFPVFAGDKAGEGAAIQNMGLAYGKLGDVQKQLECSKQYLEIVRQTGLDRRTGWQHCLLAKIFDFRRRQERRRRSVREHRHLLPTAW